MRNFGKRNFRKPKVRSNELIRVPEVRLIGPEGEQLGVVATKEALEKAQEAGLDLIEVAPTAKPPVCRILDLSKYLYSLSKKEKESRKKQKIIIVKEVKMTSKIEEHDYQTKLRNARKFSERGDKVKLTMFFRGREITHSEIGKKIVQRFIEDLQGVADVERNDGLVGNAIHVYFSPAPAPAKKAVSSDKDDSKKVEEPAKSSVNEE